MDAALNVELLRDLEQLDIIDIINGLASRFNEGNILLKGFFSRVNITSNGEVDDDKWVILEQLNHTNVYIDFTPLKFFKLDGTDISMDIIVKGHIIHNYLNENIQTPFNMRSTFIAILDFIKKSNNFSNEFINTDSGDKIKDLIEEKELAEKGKCTYIMRIRSFLVFIERVIGITKVVYSKYITHLSLLMRAYSQKSDSRLLPGSKDVVLLSYVIDSFFKEESYADIKLYYMPILIWWKLTTVIPMRISEVTRMLPRNCVKKENGKYFLKINRVKNVPRSKKAYLPILDQLEITKDVAELICNYVKYTEKYGKSNTLFSYRAEAKLRKSLLNSGYTKGYSSKEDKLNPDYFSKSIFYNLLSSFYTNIVERKYKITDSKHHVCPNDTRHFAFFSLLLQGISPIEIALLGGHTSLIAQENYQQQVKYYLDSQLFKLLYKRVSEKGYPQQKNIKNLKEIVFSMPSSADIDLDKCHSLDVGYCTCNFEDDDSCENFDDCYFCSKWWCEPNNINYKIVIKQLKEISLKRVIKQLDNDANFLCKLVNNLTLNCISNDITIDYKETMAVKTFSNKVKAECEQVAKIRYSLVDLDSINNGVTDVMTLLIENESEDYEDV